MIEKEFFRLYIFIGLPRRIKKNISINYDNMFHVKHLLVIEFSNLTMRIKYNIQRNYKIKSRIYIRLFKYVYLIKNIYKNILLLCQKINVSRETFILTIIHNIL